MIRIRHQVVVFDAADLDTQSAFWAGVLGGDIDVEQVMGLGARVLQDADGRDFQVYADPTGHPFCLCFLVGAGAQ
jgi:hypothetical protein